jgi:hypothetical protein
MTPEQATQVVGVLGLGFHILADWHNVGDNLFLRIVHGAPVFAPTLFCDLAALAFMGLWVLGWKLNQQTW